MGFRCLSGLPIFVLFLLVLSPSADAHPSLGEYVQHRYRLDVSPRDIDLTIELVFNGIHAEKERGKLDANRDGVITRQEISGYIEQWSELDESRLSLSYKGKSLKVIELQRPEVDLQDDRTAGIHPFTMRLRYFARRPEGLQEGDVITLRSGLWTAAPALVALEPQGHRSSKTPESHTGTLFPPLTEGIRAFELVIARFDSVHSENAAGSKQALKELTKP